MGADIPPARSVWVGLGARLFVVTWGSLAVIDLAGLWRLPGGWGLAGIATVVGLSGWHARPTRALTVAGVGWLFVNGFLVDDGGTLRWHGAEDVWRLLLLCGVALCVAARQNLDASLTPGGVGEAGAAGTV